MKIIDEFESWKKIMDVNGISGWISNSQLSKKEYVIIKEIEEIIYKFPTTKSKKIAIIRKNFIVRTKKCMEDWCLIKKDEIKGWVEKKSLWGYENH